MSAPSTLHLVDANADVSLSLTYGDIISVEDAGNASIKIDLETGDRKIDGNFLSARRQALLRTAPKFITYEGKPTEALTYDAIMALSASDGRALEAAVFNVYNEAQQPNVEESPKD